MTKIINATPHPIGIWNNETSSVDRIPSLGKEIRLLSDVVEPIETGKYEYRSAPHYVGIDMNGVEIPEEECDLFVSVLVGDWVANYPDLIPDHVRVIGADWGKDEKTGKSRMVRDSKGQPNYSLGFVVFRDRVASKKQKTE